MPDVRSQRTFRCAKCCTGNSFQGHGASLFEGYRWTADPPKAKPARQGRSHGNFLKVEVACRRCGHTWWTVDHYVTYEAAQAHGFTGTMPQVRSDFHAKLKWNVGPGLSPASEGDSRTGQHANACGGDSGRGSCRMSCRCWCHGFKTKPDGSPRADADTTASLEELKELVPA